MGTGFLSRSHFHFHLDGVSYCSLQAIVGAVMFWVGTPVLALSCLGQSLLITVHASFTALPKLRVEWLMMESPSLLKMTILLSREIKFLPPSWSSRIT